MIVFFLFFFFNLRKKNSLQSILSCKKQEYETLPKFLKMASRPLGMKKDSGCDCITE